MTSIRQAGEARVGANGGAWMVGWFGQCQSTRRSGGAVSFCTKRDRVLLVRPFLTPLFGEACDSPVLHWDPELRRLDSPARKHARARSRPRAWKRALPPPPLGNPSRYPESPAAPFPPFPPHWAKMTLDVEQRPWAGVRVFEAGQLGCVVGRDAVFVWLGTRAMRSIGYQPSRCPSSIGPIPEAPAAHRIRLGAQIRPTARQSCKV